MLNTVSWLLIGLGVLTLMAQWPLMAECTSGNCCVEHWAEEGAPGAPGEDSGCVLHPQEIQCYIMGDDCSASGITSWSDCSCTSSELATDCFLENQPTDRDRHNYEWTCEYRRVAPFPDPEYDCVCELSIDENDPVGDPVPVIDCLSQSDECLETTSEDPPGGPIGG